MPESQRRHRVATSRVRSLVPDGVHAVEVTVEMSQGDDGRRMDIVGLPDAAVRESAKRIQQAVRPLCPPSFFKNVLCNLSPAFMRKVGTSLDLPMAVAFAALANGLRLTAGEGMLVCGEIALDGAATGLNGALPHALACRRLGAAGLVVPNAAVEEASLVEGVNVYGVESVADALKLLGGLRQQEPVAGRSPHRPPGLDSGRFDSIRGQESAKRALILAAAGGHNMLMFGPPGSGKTLLAQGMADILPPLDLDAALSSACVRAATGSSISLERFFAPPFRAPHHTASRQALIGGGVNPRPGEISLAHHGVLFLDELPEFGRDSLEVLRQPLEDGEVTISRALQVRTFPSRFMLLAAMNPCPCGYADDHRGRCGCTPNSIARYRGRISGPLLDRIDIHLPVHPVALKKLVGKKPEGVPSHEAREAVLSARERQSSRFKNAPYDLNSTIPMKDMNRHCALTPKLERLLVKWLGDRGLSGRAFVRVLRLSRTLADLDGVPKIGESHLLEAIGYRGLDT